MTQTRVSCFLPVISLLMVTISSQAAQIDTFVTPQSNNTEISAGEAIGNARRVAASVGSASVAGGVFVCDGTTVGLGVCDLQYDGNIDSTLTIPGNLNGIDLSTGESELSLNVTSVSGDFNISIEARDTVGVLCQLSFGTVNTTGVVTVPFVPSDNMADCVAILSDLDQLTYSVITTNSGVINFNMLESTPVDLMFFEID